MNWSELIGQSAAKAYLRAALRSGRLAHAYLFKGPAGVGKRTAAYLFAQIMLCQQPPQPDESCGQCKSCSWFAARKGALIEHPDMVSLLKFSGGDSGDKLVGDHEPIIRIETMQHACEQLHRSPMAGTRRVLIVPEAQRLCRGQAEAANAFLKTLEEPPQRALIILTSSQREGLLETITSRVQQVQFRRLSAQEIRSGLIRVGQDSAELQTAAALADGSLGHALELLQGDLKNWRPAVMRELGRLGVKSAPSFGLALWTLAEEEGQRLFAAEKASEKTEREQSLQDEESGEEQGELQQKTEAGWKRYVFRRLLELCEVAFRDALVCAAAEKPDDGLLLQPDQRKLSEALARNFGQEGCQKALYALREALSAIRLYVRGDVVGRAIAGRLVEAQLAHAAN